MALWNSIDPWSRVNCQTVCMVTHGCMHSFLRKRQNTAWKHTLPGNPGRQSLTDWLVGWRSPRIQMRAYRQCQCTLSRILEPDPLIFDLNSGVFPVAVETYPYHDNASWIMYCDHVLGARFPDRGNMKAAAIILLGEPLRNSTFLYNRIRLASKGIKNFQPKTSTN